MHCWWMRSFIWGEGNEKIVWCSRQVDPQWLTVMLPVRQAHAMRLSSWRQINFSPNSPPLLHNNQPDSFSSNSFFVAKLMTAFDIQQTITMIFVRNQQHRVGPHTSITSDCAVCRQSWGLICAHYHLLSPGPTTWFPRVLDDTTCPHSNQGESLLCFRVKWTSRVQDMLWIKTVDVRLSPPCWIIA